MDVLRAAAKALIPGSPLFLIVATSCSVLFLFASPRAARRARLALVALVVLYALLSLQGTSDLLVRGLNLGRTYPTLKSRADAAGARVVVLLGNGVLPRQTPEQEHTVLNAESSFIALEGARLYRLLDAPTIVASGGPGGPAGVSRESDLLAEALTKLGVPGDRIVLENRSRTTYEQVVNVGQWLTTNGSPGFVLVTSSEHMRRAAGVFVKRGLQPIPAVSGLQHGGPPFWLPTAYALRGSEAALYEYLACVYYRGRGWL